jgi:UDP-3-O-acyl-N-acetylglucosamine deacetylase
MAALWGLGIANMSAELTGPELPILDGSSLGFVDAFSSAGLEDQKSFFLPIEIQEPVFVSGSTSAILALPHDGLKVTYTLDYPFAGLRAQTVSIEITPDNFLKQLAPARTFCSREEAERLQALGFGKGATTDNTLVIGVDGKPQDNTLRFADECARHKILDLLGDLSFMGADLRGHLIAVRSGHALNHRLRQAILENCAQRKG